MAWAAFTFPLAILVLVGFAIYEHVTNVKLSLPLSQGLTFITILLPLLAAANTFLLPYMTKNSSLALSKPNRSSISVLLRSPRFIQILQVLQGILTTILATLYAQDMVPSATRQCELSTRWQHLFRAKDGLSVRTIQDAFDCCGFRSVRDMAWPFPPAEVQCAARFDRALACQGPWTESLQRSSGINFGVVLAVGLLQVLSIFIVRQSGGGRSEGSSWGDVFRWATRRNERGGYASRPLLTSGQTQTEEVDEEVGRAGREQGGHGYGAIDEGRNQGPRIEPSGLQQERNEWQDS